MTIIGSASVQIRAVDKYFEKDVRAAVKKIKGLDVTLRADMDMAKVNKKLADLRSRLKKQTYKLNLDAETETAHTKIDKIIAKGNQDLQFNAKANTQGATTDLEKLRTRFAVNHVPVTAQANTTAASAQLAWLARHRHVPITASLDPRTIKALQGAFNALTGTLDMNAIKNAIVGILANFEGLAVKSVSIVSALGAISGAALTLGANLFTIADDITRVVGLAAAIPAVFAGGAAMIAASTIAWKGFGAALKETDPEKYAEALAKLAPEAQEAVKGLKGVGAEIAQPVREAFWESMATSLQDTVQRILPQFKRGMTDTGSLMGTFTRNWVEGFGEIVRDNRLATMFKGINGGIDNLNTGIKPFTRALITLGVEGSKYLPDFGQWIGDLGVKFDNFIQNAQKSGDIGRWIEEGTAALQDIGSVVVSTTEIFKGLAEASHMSGGASLEEFAGGMANIATVVNGEPFKSRLVAVLEGARRGTDALGEGVKQLSEFFGESAESVGIFLDQTGQLAGGALSSIVTMFRGTGLGRGLYDALDGARTALEDMEPTFRNFGTLFGDMGTIVGELLINMAPGLNQLSETMSGIIANLEQGILDAMPVFNQFVQGLLAITSGPLKTLADMVGNLLSIFSQLPTPIQNIVMALGLVALAGPKVIGAFTSIQTKAATASRIGVVSMDRLRASVSGIAIAAVGARTALGSLGTAAAAGGLAGVGAAAGTAAKGLGKSAGVGLRGALGGATALLGGPWGLAIGAGIGLIGAFGEIQAKAKQGVEDLTASLEQQTGAATAQTKTTIADRLMDVDTNAWDDFIRGNMRSSKSMTETNEILGHSFADITDKLANPRGRSEYMAAWEEISLTMLKGGKVSDELAAKVDTTAAALQEAGSGSISFYGEKIRDIGADMEKAEAKTRALAEATGTNTIVAAQLEANYATLSSTTSSVSEKFSALKQNMDLLSGGANSAKEANKSYEQSIDDTASKLQELGQSTNLAQLFDKSTGAIKLTSQAGRDLDTALQSSADSILQVGVQAFDAARKNNSSIEEAQAAALNAMDAPIQKFKQQLSEIGVPPGLIDKIVADMGLSEEDITLAISADGDQAIMEAARVQLAMDAFVNGNHTAVLAALPDEAMAGIAKAMGMTEEYQNGDYKAILKVADEQAVGGVEAFLAELLTVTDGDYTAVLEANNLIPDEVRKANEAEVKDKEAALKVKDETNGVLEQWNSTIIPEKQGKLTAQDNISEVISKVNASPLADKQNQLTTQDFVTQTMTNIINTNFPDKKMALNASDLATRVIDAVNAKTLNGKKNTLTTEDLVSIIIQNINNTQLLDKSNKLTTVHETVYTSRGNAPGTAGAAVRPMANGGILSGSGALAFKNGGILKALGNVKAFANGSEKHVAQISRGQWPVRIWAEPETGGEAYLPLAKSKRTRSMKILEQVAKTFGMGLFKTYADGGISGGSSGSLVTSSRSGNATSVSSDLLAMIERALVSRRGNLYSIGKNIVSGVMTGVNASTGVATDTMDQLGGAMENEFKRRLEIHSPSKTFDKLGRYITKGLAIGVESTIESAVKGIRDLSQRISDEATKSRDNIKKLNETIRSGKASGSTYRELNQEYRRIAAMKQVNAELAKQDGYSKKFGNEFAKKADYKVAEWMANIAQKHGKVNQATLRDYARAIENTTDRLKKAQDKLKDQISERDSFANSLSGQLKGEFNLGSVVAATDDFGYRPGASIGSIKSYASGLKSKIQKFEKLLINLKKKGVSSVVISEIAQLGSDEGTVVAEAMMRGTYSDIKSVNSSFAEITKVSDRIGLRTSNNMYLAGIQSTQGFVKGLEADRKALEKAADRLSDTLIKRFKGKLGIKSPSRVFMEIGDYVGEGFVIGLDNQQKAIDARISSMVNPNPVRGSLGDRMNTSSPTPVQSINNAEGATSGTNLQVIVNPSAGMDEKLVGVSAARELMFRYDTKV